MPVRVLTAKALNRTLLARQLLLRRSTASIPRALERVAGLQMQYAPSGYVGLWSRLADFQRPALTRALQRRAVVQATVMRSTIHLVSRRDYDLFTAGIRRERLQWWLRVTRGVDEPAVRAAADAVRDALRQGPRRATDLVEHLVGLGISKEAWNGAGAVVDLIRVPPSGTWEHRRADLYGLAEQEVGPSAATETEGLAHLVRRYLGGFGPAPLRDVANWAGVAVATLEPVVEPLGLRTFRDEDGDELLDVARAPLPDPTTQAPVRFLPTWDATLLAHARRAGVLPEEYRPAVFSVKNPQSVPTFLVDGAVAGTWRNNGGTITLDYFAPVPASVRREVRDQADALARLHAE